MSKRLSALDWIQAGFRALAAGGEGAVRVEPLARGLGVSKGSFYWHFADLADLRARMIAHWEERATADVITQIDALGGDGFQRLQELMSVALSDRDQPYGGPQTEQAIRAWARTDAAVAEAQTRVDAARMGFLQTLFRDDGQPRGAAETWARLFLYSYLGSAHADPGQRRQMIDDLMQLYADTTRAGQGPTRSDP